MERVRRDGRQLERMIGDGDDFLSHLEELNRDYKTLNLTIGGVADLLGLAFGWLLMCGQRNCLGQQLVPRNGLFCMTTARNPRSETNHYNLSSTKQNYATNCRQN